MPRPSVCDFPQLQVCAHVGTRPQANCTLQYFNDISAENPYWIWIWTQFFFFLLLFLQSKAKNCTETCFDKCPEFCTLLWVNKCVLKGPQTRKRRKAFDEPCGFWLYSDTLQETARPTTCAHFSSVCVCERGLYFSGVQCAPAINLVSFNMWLLSLQPVIAANHNSDIRTDLLIYHGSGAQMWSPALSRSTESSSGGWTWLASTPKINAFYLKYSSKCIVTCQTGDGFTLDMCPVWKQPSFNSMKFWRYENSTRWVKIQCGECCNQQSWKMSCSKHNWFYSPKYTRVIINLRFKITIY